MNQIDKRLFQLLIEGLNGDKYVIDNGPYDESGEEVIDITQNHLPDLKGIKSNDELLNLIQYLKFTVSLNVKRRKVSKLS